MRCIAVLFVLVSFACQKEIEFTIPEEESEIVIDAQIYAGDSAIAYLSRSEFYLRGTDYDFGRDSNYTVRLYEDGKWVEDLKYLRLRKQSDIFRGRYSPKPGHVYRIEASREDHKSAFGDVNIETPVLVQDAMADSLEDGRLQVSFNFDDPPQRGDSYCIKAEVDLKTPGFRNFVFLNTTDPYLYTFRYQGFLNPEPYEKVGQVFFLSDDLFNGQNREVVFNLDPDRWGDVPVKQMTIYLYRINSEYYLHMESRYNHVKTVLGIFSEPAQIRSNVTGGLGAVGGFSAQPVVVEL